MSQSPDRFLTVFRGMTRICKLSEQPKQAFVRFAVLPILKILTKSQGGVVPATPAIISQQQFQQQLPDGLPALDGAPPVVW